MRELSCPPGPRTLRFPTPRVAMLGAAAVIGPVILAGEMIAGHPLDVAAVIVAAEAMVTPAITQVRSATGP